MASFYMRFKCEDRPGVLSRISGILADHGISISVVTQKGRKENEYVPVMMLTHEAAEGHLLGAKAEIDRLPFIEGESVHIRIEPGGCRWQRRLRPICLPALHNGADL